MIRVTEPGEVYDEFRDLWEGRHLSKLDDPILRQYLLMADRHKLMQDKVIPALQRGSIVLSGRSLMSFLVYQCDDAAQLALAAYAQRFVPIPDLVVLYDLDADEALHRIKEHGGKEAAMSKPNC